MITFTTVVPSLLTLSWWNQAAVKHNIEKKKPGARTVFFCPFFS